MSQQYNNVSEKLAYICEKHKDKGEQKISFSKLMAGRGCRFCGREHASEKRMSKLNKESDKALCDSKGFVYLDTIRESGIIYIEFICPKHECFGKQRMQRFNMKRANGCKYCAGRDIPGWYFEK